MSICNEIKELRDCLYHDQSCGKRGTSLFFLRSIYNPCYSVLYTFRLGSFLLRHKNFLFLPLWIVSLLHRWNCYKTGVQIEFGTKIDKGFNIAHYGSIVINPKTIIQNDCMIFQGVTIGSKRGKNWGAPKIGHHVIMFAGSKIIGNITIGNNVIIGANAVVVKDVPDGSIVVGIPAKVISNNASDIIRHYIKY